MNTHTHTHTHTHTLSEQRAEPLCQVAGGGSRLRTSREEEERLLAGLESERHKRRRRCPGLDAAGGALEGFPGHAGRERQGRVCWDAFRARFCAVVSPLCNREV